MEAITKDTACFFTQQLFLLGTYDEDGGAHFAPYSWISFTAGPPCCLVISINGRDRVKRTVVNMERTGRLSATVVTPDLLCFVEQNNKATSREGVLLAQEHEGGRVLDVPVLKGATWSYECEVIEKVHLGGCDTYFAAYQQVNVQDAIQELDFLDLRRINPVIYAKGHYFTVGDHLGQIGDYSKDAEE